METATIRAENFKCFSVVAGLKMINIDKKLLKILYPYNLCLLEKCTRQSHRKGQRHYNITKKRQVEKRGIIPEMGDPK